MAEAAAARLAQTTASLSSEMCFPWAPCAKEGTNKFGLPNLAQVADEVDDSESSEYSEALRDHVNGALWELSECHQEWKHLDKAYRQGLNRGDTHEDGQHDVLEAAYDQLVHCAEMLAA